MVHNTTEAEFTSIADHREVVNETKLPTMTMTHPYGWTLNYHWVITEAFLIDFDKVLRYLSLVPLQKSWPYMHHYPIFLGGTYASFFRSFLFSSLPTIACRNYIVFKISEAVTTRAVSRGETEILPETSGALYVSTRVWGCLEAPPPRCISLDGMSQHAVA